MIVLIVLPGEIWWLNPGNWYNISSAYQTLEEETNFMYGGNFSFDILVLIACGDEDGSCELLRKGLFTAGGFVLSFFFTMPGLEVVIEVGGYGRFQGC